MVYPIGRIFRPIVTFPVKQIQGLENLPKNTPFILASNHNSFVDPMIISFLIPSYIKKRIYFISAMFFIFDLLANFIVSEFAGSIRLKKKVHGGFMKSALKKLKKGDIVCIFPEGFPNKKPHIRKGKTGVARLVLKAKLPIVPMGIKGTLYLWSRLKWIPRPRKQVTIKIGKPLYFNDYYNKDEDYPTLTKVTRSIMKQIAKLTDQEYKF